MPATGADIEREKVSACVRQCDAKLSPGGVRYQEPPQSGGPIFDALPVWREASIILQGPVAKNFGDGSFFVVSPKTTETDFRTMYNNRGGDEAFERELQKARRHTNYI